MPASSPEEVHAIIEQAFNDGDVDAFVELFEDDNAIMVVPADGRHVSGRDEIRAAIEPIFAMNPHVEIEVIGKVENGSMALTHGRWKLTGTDEHGEPVELTGRGTIVSRQQEDGTWRIVLDHPQSPE